MSGVGSWREPVIIHGGHYAHLCQQLHVMGACVCYNALGGKETFFTLLLRLLLPPFMHLNSEGHREVQGSIG